MTFCFQVRFLQRASASSRGILRVCVCVFSSTVLKSQQLHSRRYQRRREQRLLDAGELFVVAASCPRPFPGGCQPTDVSVENSPSSHVVAQLVRPSSLLLQGCCCKYCMTSFRFPPLLPPPPPQRIDSSGIIFRFFVRESLSDKDNFPLIEKSITWNRKYNAKKNIFSHSTYKKQDLGKYVCKEYTNVRPGAVSNRKRTQNKEKVRVKQINFHLY